MDTSSSKQRFNEVIWTNIIGNLAETKKGAKLKSIKNL
jgi:hypothetical protein